ncbi:MAG: hypothetical protein NTZ57_01000, partial [Deltaproteobacteria bacterium]|nr:hypothetical protein [Deltaproteobacteria bacterium]
MIIPYIHNRSYDIVSDCREKVAEVNTNLMEATFETLKTNQHYWLNLPAHLNDAIYPCWRSLSSFIDLGKTSQENNVETGLDSMKAGQLFWLGILGYLHDFMFPYWTAVTSFTALEKKKLVETSPLETMLDYLELMQFNRQVAEKGLSGSLKSMNDYSLKESTKALQALTNTFFDREGFNLKEFTARQARQLDLLVNEYPQAIRAIKQDYGFHFDDGGYIKTAETDRFILYQVLPQNRKVKIRKG